MSRTVVCGKHYPHGLFKSRCRFRSIPSILKRFTSAFLARSLARHGAQRAAVLSMLPPISSYHHFCCLAVQISCFPQSLQVKGRSS